MNVTDTPPAQPCPTELYLSDFCLAEAVSGHNVCLWTVQICFSGLSVVPGVQMQMVSVTPESAGKRSCELSAFRVLSSLPGDFPASEPKVWEIPSGTETK